MKRPLRWSYFLVRDEMACDRAFTCLVVRGPSSFSLRRPNRYLCLNEWFPRYRNVFCFLIYFLARGYLRSVVEIFLANGDPFGKVDMKETPGQ